MLTIKMYPQGHAKAQATMAQVNLTDVIAAGGVHYQPVDTNGNPVPTKAADVTSTMDIDPVAKAAGVTVTPKDSLSYNLSFPPAVASGNSVVTDSGVLSYVAGTPGPFDSAMPILCNLPAPPPQAVDVQILLG